MYDKYELPPPTRVVIPRVRNGEILVGNGEDDRARLLGILAIMIAEVNNPVVHNLVRLEAQRQAIYEEHGVDPFKYTDTNDLVKVDDSLLDALLEAMTLLMENTVEVAMLIIGGRADQSDADKEVLSIFANFVDSLPS